MRRLLAAISVALIAGTGLLPGAVAAVVVPPIAHACCIRKHAHAHCSPTAQPTLSSPGECCHRLMPSTIERVRAPRPTATFSTTPVPAFSYASEFYPQALPQQQPSSQKDRSPPPSAASQ